MEDDKEFERALFRFSLISPLIHCDDESERRRLMRLIVSKELDIPYSDKRYITEKTLLNYLKRYQQNGFEGLKRNPRKDKNILKSISSEIKNLICDLKEEEPGRSSKQIIRLILSMEEHSGLSLKERTVSRVLKKNGLSRKSVRPKKIYRSFEMENINELWQTDISDGVYLAPKGKMTYCFAFLDDHSRVIPHAQFYYDEKLPRLEDCFKKAILKRGVPKAVYADNGKIFISNHFKRICAELGVRLLNHLPYSPQSKGKVERFFLRMQNEFLIEAHRVVIHSIDELNSYFQAWLDVQYHRTEHHGIGTTPIDRFTKALKTTTIRTVESLEEITEIFLYREKRKVHKSNGVVRLSGNRYQVTDAALLDTEIEARFDPYDLSKIYIYKENIFVQIAYPISIKNSVYGDIPEESQNSESITRKSSTEFFTRLKQREQEINRQENKHLDFTKFKNNREN